MLGGSLGDLGRLILFWFLKDDNWYLRLSTDYNTTVLLGRQRVVEKGALEDRMHIFRLLHNWTRGQIYEFSVFSIEIRPI